VSDSYWGARLSRSGRVADNSGSYTENTLLHYTLPHIPGGASANRSTDARPQISAPNSCANAFTVYDVIVIFVTQGKPQMTQMTQIVRIFNADARQRAYQQFLLLKNLCPLYNLWFLHPP